MGDTTKARRAREAKRAIAAGNSVKSTETASPGVLDATSCVGDVARSFDPIGKARRNPRSMRLAINGKCWDCIGGGADPNPRKMIRECSVTKCTLWPLRPYQRKDDETAEEAAE